MFFPKKLTFKYLQDGYKSGNLTPELVVKEIMKRAAKYADYNVWITNPDVDSMMKYIEGLPEKASEEYPLWGIPFAIKDNIDLKGIPTTAGCSAYSYDPVEHATVVKKLIAMGAIPVGKTNLDQFATGLVGTRSPYGEVRNAINPELISGGSSSGSAVVVALGMAAFSLGTDTAGSGRVPAALNKLVGYKPALGAWSTKGVVPACASLDCVTVMANSLDDAVTVDTYARGVDEGCCWSKDYGERSIKKPKKVLLPKEEPEFFGDYQEEYRSAWRKALNRINKMNLKVEYIDYSPFSQAAAILYDGPWVAERWKDLGDFVQKNPEQLFPVTERILRSGSQEKYTAAKVFEAIHTLQEYKHQVKSILDESVLIMPTIGGTFTRQQVRENPIETNSQLGLYTNHCNLLDLCAVNVPACVGDQTPFGITIFSLAQNEGMIISAAEAFEKTETIDLVVCGLHKQGYPLEYQLLELGAEFKEHAMTAAKYKLYEFNTVPKKPGIIKVGKGGGSIAVDVYSLPLHCFGAFMKQVPAPLSIGSVEMNDGSVVAGFLGEVYASETGEDMTAKGIYTI
ncbi:allophanate hydrolase [Spirochaeta cellobiosiphila]|uniref:allophanate hydrolase n=1 Tax=Spirochaeta cellobiosiphila TaxID=504483 RepID=UPI0004227166|nr:allophanate hydrolase [Spirochaeta cellobiosiphila]